MPPTTVRTATASVTMCSGRIDGPMTEVITASTNNPAGDGAVQRTHHGLRRSATAASRWRITGSGRPPAGPRQAHTPERRARCPADARSAARKRVVIGGHRGNRGAHRRCEPAWVQLTNASHRWCRVRCRRGCRPHRKVPLSGDQVLGSRFRNPRRGDSLRSHLTPWWASTGPPVTRVQPRSVRTQGNRTQNLSSGWPGRSRPSATDARSTITNSRAFSAQCPKS